MHRSHSGSAFQRFRLSRSPQSPLYTENCVFHLEQIENPNVWPRPPSSPSSVSDSRNIAPEASPGRLWVGGCALAEWVLVENAILIGSTRKSITTLWQICEPASVQLTSNQIKPFETGFIGYLLPGNWWLLFRFIDSGSPFSRHRNAKPVLCSDQCVTDLWTS